MSEHCRTVPSLGIPASFLLAEGGTDPFGADLIPVRLVALQSAWFADPEAGRRQLEELARRSGANCLTDLKRVSRAFGEATLHSWTGCAGIYAHRAAGADPELAARVGQVCAALQLDSADLDEYRDGQERGRGFLVYLCAALLLAGLALLVWMLAF